MATSPRADRVDSHLAKFLPPASADQSIDEPQPGNRSRQVLLALIIASAVIIPRSYLIAKAHSPSIDDDYHLTRGLVFLTRSFAKTDLRMNDPPLGEGLIALPMLVTNLLEGRAPADDRLYDRPGRAETVMVRTALGNAVLFLPLVAATFLWCQSVYGLKSAWLATALILIDPTFSAHVATAALDVLGVTGTVIGCCFCWRYFENPTFRRLVAAAVATGVALMLKHTSTPLPLVIALTAVLTWGVKPWLAGVGLSPILVALPSRLRDLAVFGAVTLASMWTLTLFDVSPPISPTTSIHAAGTAEAVPANGARSIRLELERTLGLMKPWPGGIYLRAFRSGLGHGMGGHEAFLQGEKRLTGWWYYFPVVATYKVPIGIAAVMLLALLSLRTIPPRWSEWGLFIPLLVWTLFMMKSKVNIGFRHFLPAYIFFLMLASRCLARGGRTWMAAAWSAVAIAAIHAASFHPDYLSYINFPRHKPHLEISDSNIDWGQALKQVREWVDSHSDRRQPIWLYAFAKDRSAVAYYLGDRVNRLERDDDPPTHGLLLISGVREAGPYDPRQAYRALWPYSPDETIGHCIFAYDLDRIGANARVTKNKEISPRLRAAMLSRERPRN